MKTRLAILFFAANLLPAQPGVSGKGCTIPLKLKAGAQRFSIPGAYVLGLCCSTPA